jgi:hypothetical protein
MKNFTLLAFSAERRIAAVALFRGTHLEGTRLRHLPLNQSRAMGNLRELVTRSLEHYRPEFVAISRPASKAGNRIRTFCEEVKEISSGLGIPLLEVDDVTLMAAYGHPTLKRKQHVRRVGRAIWPELSYSTSKRAVVDAATTGLYVQTQRLFSLHEVAA